MSFGATCCFGKLQCVAPSGTFCVHIYLENMNGQVEASCASASCVQVADKVLSCAKCMQRNSHWYFYDLCFLVGQLKKMPNQTAHLLQLYTEVCPIVKA